MTAPDCPGFPVSPPLSWSSAEQENAVDRLIGRFGPSIRTETIGQSVCGTRLTALRVGSGPKRILLSAAHHANEWITAPALTACIGDLLYEASCEEAPCRTEAGEILRRCTLVFVPLVNPDGVDLVNGALPPARAEEAADIARLRPDIPFPAGWKANIRGVDLNLQYPALWETARENKSALGVMGPAPQNYVGPKPLSEPESRALFDLTLREDPDLVLAFHTQGETIYWRFFDRDIPGSRELGESLSRESGYSLEDTPYVSGFAGYKDWFIDAFRRPGYTVEFGRGTNPLPPDQFGRIRETCAKIIAAAALAI